MGILLFGGGFWVLILCIAMVIMMIRRKKQSITPESKFQWESGVLTDKVIKKDLSAHGKTVIFGYFVFAAVLASFAIPFIYFTEEEIAGGLIFAVLSFAMLVQGIKAVINRRGELKYRIETDKVLGGDIKTISNRTTHVPIRKSVLYLEKYGEYAINPMQIRGQFPPEALVKMIKPGEEVFVVYSVKTNKLLHIYLKSLWERTAD